jgi:hypothetical protein
MPEAKINFRKLDELLREGKTGVEAAQYFGVSPGAISKARKQLKSTVIRTVALERTTEVIDAHLDILGQAQKTNRIINNELDAAILDIEAARKQGKDPKSIQDIIIRLAAEIRKQTETYISMAEAWRDFKEYEEFKAEILDLLKMVPEETRRAFESKVKERGLLRGTLSIDPA